MQKVHVARQPIFKARNKLYAYELLFRDGPSNAFPKIDGDTATTQVLNHSFFSFDFDQLTAGAYGFVNFTQELLVRRVPLMFPPERLVVEILEDVEPREPVLAACRELAKAGYRLVLDDFILGKKLDPFIELASMIKFDVRQSSMAEIALAIRETRGTGVEYLAEKVETWDEVSAATDAGCTYFQGYWFARPELMTTRDVRPQAATLLQLIRESSQPDLRVDELERLVSRDVSITYKLLRYINSAFFRRARPIESVRQAIIYLGEREIRQFIALVATSKLCTNKPDELVRTSLIRARACDALGKLLPSDRVDVSELFLLGLLSSIDAIMDRPMSEVLRDLPLAPSLRVALSDGQGTLAECLALVLDYERGAWEDFARRARNVGIDEKAYPAIHLEAVAWAQSFIVLPD